jgi:3-oxosteroid 1-dehydrogenase
MEWHEEVDLVVLGSGGSGLTAALVAATRNLRVVVLERTDKIGGTTAYSSGTLWVPGYSSFEDDDSQRKASEAASRYLDRLVGNSAPKKLRDTFLNVGPQMMRYLAAHSDVKFRSYPKSPDYHQDLSGASAGGQAHEPLPFDATALGQHFESVRWPIPELMLFGGLMITRSEAAQLLRVFKSVSSIALGFKLVGRFVLDRMRFKRGTRLVLGNALVGRLYKSLLDRNVDVRLLQQVTALTTEGEQVTGVEVEDRGVRRRIRAIKGVILAGGGFPASPSLREKYLPKPTAPFTPACPSCVGETIALGQAAGAKLGEVGTGAGFWFPSSVMTRADGSTAVYPHIVLDRAKPGLIAVNKSGQRFLDEAVSYHEFGRRMHEAHLNSPAIPALLVCDRAFIFKYGLGLIRPMTPSLRRYIDCGYLLVGKTLRELADKAAVDGDGLQRTIDRYNGFALTGIDLDFHKGENIYDQSNGDPDNLPNPCIGVIKKAPFYGVLVYPTAVATSLGLATDEKAQVLSAENRAIPGLYACGNDMNSVMGGNYQGPGGQLGPGMTFAYVAASHASGVAT